MSRKKIASAICLMLGEAVVANSVAAKQPEQLEEIIVTAEKRAESLQKTNISIVALTEDSLEIRGISGLTDLRSQVPNLQLTPHPNSAGTALLYIRGIGLTDDQITQDPSVAMYVDGIYVARSQGLASSVAELERVEVLRGPQGTLYGRNATGGAVNFISKAPSTGEWRFKQQISFGNRDRFDARTSVNVPIGEDFAVRIGYLKEKENGFIKNLGTGVARYGDKDREAWRIDALWKASNTVTVRYAYDETNINDTPFYAAPATLFPKITDRPTAGGALARNVLPNDVKSSGHSLTVTWDVGPRMQIKSLTGYRKLDNFQNQIFYANPVTLGNYPLLQNAGRTHQEQLSEELQFLGSSADDRWKYVAGIYYFWEKGDANAITQTIRNPVNSVTASLQNQQIHNESTALFGQATWTPDVLDNRLHLTVGGRWSSDSRSASKYQASQTILPVRGAIVPDPTAPGGVANGDKDFRNFSPSFVAAYDINDTTNVYGKVVRGYKSGGYNVRAPSPAAFAQGFSEETLESTELGLKTQMFNNKLRLNSALFQAKYDDIQVNVQADPLNPAITNIFNAGKATIRGLELEATALLTRGLVINANYAYLYANYDKVVSPATGKDVSSTFRFPNAPGHAANVDITYELPRIPVGLLTANLNYSWQGQKFSQTSVATSQYIIGDYSLLNARLSLSEMPGLKGVRLAVWGKNLADTKYYVGHFNAGAPTAVFGAPRSYGIDMIYEF
ncbi:TonB-dependent receptor [Denitratisoma sp. DHT3]|uniref:TonB-dependent receptor n=1 Tax=Denitratisoma sp. DHT3 TaxID=1981880 RepID=UPI001198520A|nr:TonB-dependent receptor [Denitratisoma sp. DHT3]QDX82651.1 TonB-dependent receptor [Denitratisoma sp. DHT3]